MLQLVSLVMFSLLVVLNLLMFFFNKCENVVSVFVIVVVNKLIYVMICVVVFVVCCVRVVCLFVFFICL